MVKRTRIISGDCAPEATPPEEGQYRGYGTTPGETHDDFRERMFSLPPFEAMFYEAEVMLAFG
jgi:hypothetical protein